MIREVNRLGLSTKSIFTVSESDILSSLREDLFIFVNNSPPQFVWLGGCLDTGGQLSPGGSASLLVFLPALTSCPERGKGDQKILLNPK